MKKNKIEKDIIDTGVRITLERSFYKRWTKTSVKRMLTALDIAKEYELEGIDDWEDNREKLEAWLNEH